MTTIGFIEKKIGNLKKIKRRRCLLTVLLLYRHHPATCVYLSLQALFLYMGVPPPSIPYSALALPLLLLGAWEHLEASP